MKDGKTILGRSSSYRATIQPELKKYNLVGETSLLITNLKASDAGNYSCKMTFISVHSTVVDGNITKLIIPVLKVEHCMTSVADYPDGCDCLVNGTAWSQVTCEASGFLHEPRLRWIDETRGNVSRSEVSWRSTLNLTNIRENKTFTCHAYEQSFDDIKSVCLLHNDNNSDNVIPDERMFSDIAGWKIAIILIFLFILGVVALCLMRRNKSSLKRIRSVICDRTRRGRYKKSFPSDGDGYDHEKQAIEVDREATTESTKTPVGSTEAVSKYQRNEREVIDGAVAEDILERIQQDKHSDIYGKPFNEVQPAALKPLALLILGNDYNALTDRVQQNLFKKTINRILEPYRPSNLSKSCPSQGTALDGSLVLSSHNLSASFMPEDENFLNESKGRPSVGGYSAACFMRRVGRALTSILNEDIQDMCELVITNPFYQLDVNIKKIPPLYDPSKVPKDPIEEAKNKMQSSLFMASDVNRTTKEELQDLELEMKNMFQSLDQKEKTDTVRDGISKIILEAYKILHLLHGTPISEIISR